MRDVLKKLVASVPFLVGIVVVVFTDFKNEANEMIVFYGSMLLSFLFFNLLYPSPNKYSRW